MRLSTASSEPRLFSLGLPGFPQPISSSLELRAPPHLLRNNLSWGPACISICVPQLLALARQDSPLTARMLRMPDLPTRVHISSVHYFPANMGGSRESGAFLYFIGVLGLIPYCDLLPLRRARMQHIHELYFGPSHPSIDPNAPTYGKSSNPAF